LTLFLRRKIKLHITATIEALAVLARSCSVLLLIAYNYK